jgi:hypothetical protein
MHRLARTRSEIDAFEQMLRYPGLARDKDQAAVAWLHASRSPGSSHVHFGRLRS